MKKSKIVELLNSRQKYVSNRMSFTALFRDGLPEIMDAIKEKLAFVEQRRGYLVFGVEHAWAPPLANHWVFPAKTPLTLSFMDEFDCEILWVQVTWSILKPENFKAPFDTVPCAPSCISHHFHLFMLIYCVLRESPDSPKPILETLNKNLDGITPKNVFHIFTRIVYRFEEFVCWCLRVFVLDDNFWTIPERKFLELHQILNRRKGTWMQTYIW